MEKENKVLENMMNSGFEFIQEDPFIIQTRGGYPTLPIRYLMVQVQPCRLES